MRIAKVLGTVTLSRGHASLRGLAFRAVEAADRLDQLQDEHFGGDLIIACDGVGSGCGDLVALAEGPEAAQPYRPEVKCVDGYIAAILDDVSI